MIKQLYRFNWNATDRILQQHQESNYQKVLELWAEDFDNYFKALIITHHNLVSYWLIGGFLLFRRLVKFLSEIVLSNVAPRIAQTISNWGEEDNKPWSLALFHENIINR